MSRFIGLSHLWALLVFGLMALSTPTNAQDVVLSGVVRDSATNRPLVLTAVCVLSNSRTPFKPVGWQE